MGILWGWQHRAQASGPHIPWGHLLMWSYWASCSASLRLNFLVFKIMLPLPTSGILLGEGVKKTIEKHKQCVWRTSLWPFLWWQPQWLPADSAVSAPVSLPAIERHVPDRPCGVGSWVKKGELTHQGQRCAESWDQKPVRHYRYCIALQPDMVDIPSGPEWSDIPW